MFHEFFSHFQINKYSQKKSDIYLRLKKIMNEEANSVLQYTRYVDDIICLFNNEEDEEIFFAFINKQHKVHL